jgi:hypothetical protein
VYVGGGSTSGLLPSGTTNPLYRANNKNHACRAITAESYPGGIRREQPRIAEPPHATPQPRIVVSSRTKYTANKGSLVGRSTAHDSHVLNFPESRLACPRNWVLGVVFLHIICLSGDRIRCQQWTAPIQSVRVGHAVTVRVTMMETSEGADAAPSRGSAVECHIA